MTSYSHQNRVTFGYGNTPFGQRAPGQELWFHFGRCTRTPLSFKDENRQTALLAYEQAEALGRPVYVLLSGGLDSAVMVKGFIEAGVPFKTATYEFTQGQNAQEMQYIRPFVEAEKLDAHYLKMDPRAFVNSSEAHEWFHLTHSCEIGTLPLMKLMHHVWFELGGMPVFGGGDMDIVKNEQGTWDYSRYESFISRYWFSHLYGLDHFVSFFQHTPEMVLSMLNEPLIHRAASGQDPLANRILQDLKAVKFKVYHSNWPDLRRRIKFGGTELIHGWLKPIEDRWNAERALRYDTAWIKPYLEMVADLSPGSVDQSA